MIITASQFSIMRNAHSTTTVKAETLLPGQLFNILHVDGVTINEQVAKVKQESRITYVICESCAVYTQHSFDTTGAQLLHGPAIDFKSYTGDIFNKDY